MLHLRGIVQSAELVEHPPGSDRVEMALRLQGVGPGQPRRIVVPFEMLVENPDLDEESIAGHALDADVEEDPAGSSGWVVARLSFAARRILRKDPRAEGRIAPAHTGSPGSLAMASESARPMVVSDLFRIVGEGFVWPGLSRSVPRNRATSLVPGATPRQPRPHGRPRIVREISSNAVSRAYPAARK